jgi:hypothetical protein
MAGQNADETILARHLHFVHLLVDQLAFGSDNFKIERHEAHSFFKAWARSNTSSMVPCM